MHCISSSLKVNDMLLKMQLFFTVLPKAMSPKRRPRRKSSVSRRPSSHFHQVQQEQKPKPDLSSWISEEQKSLFCFIFTSETVFLQDCTGTFTYVKNLNTTTLTGQKHSFRLQFLYILNNHIITSIKEL